MKLPKWLPFAKEKTPKNPEIDIYELDQELSTRCLYIGALIEVGESRKAGYRPIWEDKNRSTEKQQKLRDLAAQNKKHLVSMDEGIYSLPEKMKRRYLKEGETESTWNDSPIGQTIKALITDYEKELQDYNAGIPKTMDTEFFIRNTEIIVSEGLTPSTNRETFEDVCERYLEERTRHKKFQAAARTALTFRAFVKDSIGAETEDCRNESRAAAQAIAEAVKILIDTGHIPPK